MTKVMILENDLATVISLEKILTDAGYEVCVLTGAFGIFAKFDFEKPDILLFNPDMPNVDTDAVLDTLMNASQMSHLIVVLICRGDAEAVETYCRQMNLNGYYMIDNGLADIVAYLHNFDGEFESDEDA